MRAFLAVCVVLVAAASASGLRRLHPTPRSVLTDTIVNIMEKMRPKLVDLFIADVPVGEVGHVSNMSLHNLESFHIDAMKGPPLNPLSFKIVNATISVPWVEGDALYLLDQFELPHLGVVLNGEGPAAGRVEGVRFEADNIQFRLEDGLTPVVEDYGNVAIDLATAHLTMEGVPSEVTEAITSDIPRLLREEVHEYIQVHKAEILKFINEALAGQSAQ